MLSGCKTKCCWRKTKRIYLGGSPYGSTNGVIMVLGCHYNPILGLYGFVLRDGIEAGTLFLPLRLVLAPDITVSHDRGSGVLGVKIS